MNIKGVLFAIIGIAISGNLVAQDKIFKSNGDVIDTRIKSVGTRNIIYSHFDNPSGPEYVIQKREVDKIRYQNGSEESFTNDRMSGGILSHRESNERFKGKYKPNIIAFAPIQFTEAGIAGFSFSYEHAIDHNGIVAFYVPAIMEFNPNANNNYVYGATPTSTDGMFYVMPGIKLYPTGSYGIAKYAIGPSLVIGDGQKTTYYDPYAPSGVNPYVSQDHFIFGMMVNQSININPTPHLYIGSEFGFGFTYLNKLAGVNQGTTGLVQFSFKLGYRF